MRKSLCILLLIVLLPCFSSAETIVTSFYPIWLMALNLTQGMDGVEVCNLAAPTTGCLHDYQLQVADMKLLARADCFLVNGAGMESFLPLLKDAFPSLPIVQASDGIPLLKETDSLQIGESEQKDSEEAEVNAHLWLDAARASMMAENLAAGIITVLPAQADRVRANLAAFQARLLSLDEQLRIGLSGLSRREIVTFHEAFPYFAEAYGLDVVAIVNREPGEALSPSQLADLARKVASLGNPPLFVEPQYDSLNARTLSAETGAAVYFLDPVVTGPEENVPLDYYETVMLRNMGTLQEALSAQQ